MNALNVPANKRSVFSITLLMTFILMTFVLQKPVLLIGGAVICAVYACICFQFSTFRNKDLSWFLVVCIFFLPGMTKYSHGLSPFFYFFSTIAIFFAAKAASRYPPQVFLISFRIIYTVAVTGIAYALYVYWDMPEPLGEVIEGSSANGIPAYLIVMQVSLSLCNYVVLQKLPVLSPIITAIVAFFGYGRGSLVVAGLLVMFTLLFNLSLSHASSRRYKVFLTVFLLGLAIAVVGNYDQIEEAMNLYTKLGAGLVDQNRLEIWGQYLEKINLWTLLIGADYTGTVIELQYASNPHISFVRTHALFGLPITLLALFSPLIVFFTDKAWSAKLIFATFIGLLMMRAMSEPILFPTLLDFFFFLNLFLFFRYVPKCESAFRVHRELSSNSAIV
ncbi:hypothetical protein LPB67_08945 [Undibacterium sp. Jales W-56]|uniref:hypothetical protein n=1 Tax=Undibacterium sp. Jales W-56 TaxID=2897325 RepID=UPI0021CF3553|nr:hypothetical protein [Undibacterium sp. Jales W-56]MCU6433903.1 hypothetical protein [Undibacterium sp. Jales W-56]